MEKGKKMEDREGRREEKNGAQGDWVWRGRCTLVDGREPGI
jgi:hypothetical protein